MVMGMSEFEREFEKFRKCMSEECFRWAVGLCWDIKHEYWHCYLKCMGVHMTNPDMTLDKCHELCLGEIMRRYDFSKDALKECLMA